MMGSVGESMRYIRLFAMLLFVAPVLTVFQNCTKATFEVPSDSIQNKAYDTFTLLDGLVFVEMNTTKTFDVKYTGEKGALLLSTSDTEVGREIRTAHGTVRIDAGTDFVAKYTPDDLFRGEDAVHLYVVDPSGQGGKPYATITFQVGNRISYLKPALALRGPGCTSCHAQITSNLVTDFGYGDYYLNTGRPGAANPWYGFYTDHDNRGADSGTIATLDLAATSQVFVPAVPLAGYPKELTGETTLAGYMRNRFSVSYNPGTKAAAANVKEVKSMFIGAPTAARLLQAFEVNAQAGAAKYIPNDATSPVALAGVAEAQGGVFKVSGTVQCDGDLLLQGTVLLNGVTIQSIHGCRIYSTGSIFVNNGLTSSGLNSSEGHNIQLVSTRAILLGLGNTLNSAGNATCESAGWYRDRWASGTQDEIAKSSLFMHLRQNTETSYTRTYGANANADAFLASVYNEGANLGLKDATCEAGGRAVPMNRLLVVAPRVDSRYSGNFSGSVVAEAAVMSVGSFKFSFDPIFEKAAILPMLKDADFLSIEE